MQRGSDKHGPTVDEQLKEEVEPLERGAPTSSRVEEHRDTEAPAEDEADIRSNVDEAEIRSSIARWLNRVAYPARRDRLIDEARSNNAPPRVVEFLSALPEDASFGNVEEIWEALGGSPEVRF